MIRWANDRVCYIDRPNPDLEALLDAKFHRRTGLLQWDVDEGTGIVERALSFVATVSSGFATEEVVARRRELCFSCPARVLDRQGASYCSGCKCGKWQLAMLDGSVLPKLKWRDLKCPLGRF